MVDPLHLHKGVKLAQVVVVGAGIAGLAATAELAQSGLNILLVEASNYFGGRVKQAKPFAGWPPVDLGGEFIHGCDTITYRLAVENNWPMEMVFDYSPELEAEWIYLDGKMYPFHSSQSDIVAAHAAWEDFVEHKSNRGSEKDETDDGDDISAATYFASNPQLNNKTLRIFETVFCQTEAANLDTYGCLEQGDFEKSYPCGPGNFRLKNSQEVLVNHYLERCRNCDKILNWQAKIIDYSDGDEGKSTAPYRITVTNQNGQILQAQAVIVCVPLTVLKDRDICFIPDLPEDKQLAIRTVQMHTGLKIICRFSRRFWPPKCNLVFNCTSDIRQLWMYTNVKEETGEECHLVTGFQTAKYARQKTHLTGDEVKAIFLHDLDDMFGKKGDEKPATVSFIDFVYYHWSSHPFVRGAYSSPSVHARGSRVTLANPVGNRVFFAGEATRSGGDSCTISGAIESGRRAAEKVRKALNVLNKLSTTGIREEETSDQQVIDL